MKFVAFNAKCPFEIGDKVLKMGRFKTITDIACIHYVKSGVVAFLYELDESRTYLSFNPQHPDLPTK